MQIPLALRFPGERRFEQFAGAAPAVSLLATIARGERSDWTCLSGPAGTGKTHLLAAVCAEAQRVGRRAAYLPLDVLGTRLGDAADAVEGTDLVAIDVLDAVAGNDAAERGLFHLHNRLRATGGTVLYGSRVPALQLPVQLPDLRSRLGQCTQLLLEPLPESGRRVLLRRRAAERGLELDDAVLDYLFRRHARDLGSMLDLLERIDRESLAAQRRVTVPFLRGLLGG